MVVRIVMIRLFMLTLTEVFISQLNITTVLITGIISHQIPTAIMITWISAQIIGKISLIALIAKMVTTTNILAFSMIYEGNGWWKYTLTGIATPGKALIMFASGHSYADNMQRYPGQDQVGIPLFDYPNREGWFDLTGSSRQFSSTKPADIPYRTYRLYWPKSSYDGINIWYNNGSGIINSINASEFGSEGNYYFYDWYRMYDGNEASTYLSIEGRKGANGYYDKRENYRLNEFIESPAGSGIYCYTRNGNGTDGYSGKPGSTPTYRIWWYKDSRNACHIDGLYHGR